MAKRQLRVWPGLSPAPVSERFPLPCQRLMPTRFEYARAFFRRYYTPDNTFLIVVGDFDPDDWSEDLPYRLIGELASAGTAGERRRQRSNVRRGSFRLGRDFRGLFDDASSPPTNVFLLKVNYWLNP